MNADDLRALQAPLKDKDGSDLYEYRKRIDLSAPGMMRLPPAKRAERGQISDLISTLSLLDSDPVARLASIRDVGERAMGAFSADKDVQSKAMDELPKYSKALRAQGAREHNATFLNAINEALAGLDAALGDRPAQMSAINSVDVRGDVSHSDNSRAPIGVAEQSITLSRDPSRLPSRSVRTSSRLRRVISSSASVSARRNGISRVI